MKSSAYCRRTEPENQAKSRHHVAHASGGDVKCQYESLITFVLIDECNIVLRKRRRQNDAPKVGHFHWRTYLSTESNRSVSEGGVENGVFARKALQSVTSRKILEF